VQTGWQPNVTIYKALTAPRLVFDESSLRAALAACGAGMVTVRARGLADFFTKYWAEPDWYVPQPGETFAGCRDRLDAWIHGLGMAKISFALELCFPEICSVVCVDRHLARLYGLRAESMTPQDYRGAEDHWREACYGLGVAPTVARHVWWNLNQKPPRKDTRYWSHVFEGH
jgi:hypothetical protein